MSVADELRSIYDRHGRLTPELVVDEARVATHPLHTHFEWSDAEAAEMYRLGQASALIRRVNVVRIVGDAEPRRVRAWVARQELMRPAGETDDDEVGPGEYVPVEEVASEPAWRSAWQASLERDWKRLRKRAGDAKWFLDMVAADVVADRDAG